jgi:uncharacterized protein (DUF885 family)
MKTRKIFITLIILISIAVSGCASAFNNETQTSGAIVSAETSQPTTLEAKPSTIHLEGLPIETFFEAAFELILARDEEWVVEMGLDDLLDGEPSLTGFGPDDIAFENALHEEILSLLHQYDYSSLTLSDQISYQVFEFFLQGEIQRYENMEYEYLVNPVSVRSWPQLFVMFFTDTHPLSTKVEAEAYVARVKLLDDKIDELILRLEMQEQAGIFPPRLVTEYGMWDVPSYIGTSASTSPIRSNFLNKASTISDLTEDEHTTLNQELSDTLENEVFPAFERLDDYLAELVNTAPNNISLSQYPGGLEYYEFLLREYTTTELSAEEVHSLGLSELDRIKTDIRQKFSKLDYPENESIPDLYQQMTAESGTLNGDAITKEYESILQAADKSLDDYFDLRPAGVLEVVGGDVGAYYSPGALDGSRPGQFFARINSSEPIYKMKTVAYHEGIPGHHYQVALAQQADIPLFRNLLIFDGYTEGWALYAEYLASELGWYEDDPYGDLGRLQYEALRACRMIVDTGIHAKGWSFEQSANFIVENTGLPRGYADYEVVRYISYPGQAPAYLVGKIEIMRLRDIAAEKLGDDFDLREFHNIILMNGSMPLSLLEIVITDWIEESS